MAEYEVQWQVTIREKGPDEGDGFATHFGTGDTPLQALENAEKFMGGQLETIQARRQILRTIRDSIHG